MTSMQELAWIDMLGLAIVGAFTILGLVRGLWWQVVRLVGVVAAVAVARLYSPRWSPVLAEHMPTFSPQLVQGITRVGIFLLTLIAASLLGLIGKKFIEAIHLDLMDRVGGIVAGLATGVIVHAALLVGICELGSPEWSQRTVQGTQSQRLLYSLASQTHLILDAAAAERMRPWLEGPEDSGSGDSPGD